MQPDGEYEHILVLAIEELHDVWLPADQFTHINGRVHRRHECRRQLDAVEEADCAALQQHFAVPVGQHNGHAAYVVEQGVQDLLRLVFVHRRHGPAIYGRDGGRRRGQRGEQVFAVQSRQNNAEEALDVHRAVHIDKGRVGSRFFVQAFRVVNVRQDDDAGFGGGLLDAQRQLEALHIVADFQRGDHHLRPASLQLFQGFRATRHVHLDDGAIHQVHRGADNARNRPRWVYGNDTRQRRHTEYPIQQPGQSQRFPLYAKKRFANISQKAQ